MPLRENSGANQHVLLDAGKSQQSCSRSALAASQDCFFSAETSILTPQRHFLLDFIVSCRLNRPIAPATLLNDDRTRRWYAHDRASRQTSRIAHVGAALLRKEGPRCTGCAVGVRLSSLFGESVQRLRLIQQAQRLGFALADIRSVLDSAETGNLSNAIVIEAAQERYLALEAQITRRLVQQHELRHFSPT